MGPIFWEGINLMRNMLPVILRDFSYNLVHEVWLGYVMTPEIHPEQTW